MIILRVFYATCVELHSLYTTPLRNHAVQNGGHRGDGKMFSQTYVSAPLTCFLLCIQFHGKIKMKNKPIHSLFSRIETYRIIYSDADSLMIEGKEK
jgi:hypothetical protein